MSDIATHDHIFLGAGHERNERRSWAVIALCLAMMVVEISGGLWFGSIALVADGLHMSTHAGALLLTAVAYGAARRMARSPRFTFGTGKIGDLAGFTSAIVLVMIAVLIGYESLARLLHPVTIDFNQAIPIAVLGLAVNIASVWLLGGGHDHGHGHDHHGHDHGDEHDHHDHGHDHDHGHPHAAPAAAARDNNMRSAVIHVMADAAVSVLVIVGLVLGRWMGWMWMDPLVGVAGAVVIASWGYGLARDTGRILLDVTPDMALCDRLRGSIEGDGDQVTDLHLWRLGPGHLGAIVSIRTPRPRDLRFYRERLAGCASLSHLTIEIERA